MYNKRLSSECSRRRDEQSGLYSLDSSHRRSASGTHVPFPEIDLFTPKVELYEETGGMNSMEERAIQGIMEDMFPEPPRRGRKPVEVSLGVRDSICVLCSKIFSKEYLSVHMANVHEKRRDFSCPTCGKDFGQKTSLNNHVRTVHNKIKDYQCAICAKYFGQKTTLMNHIKNVHEKRKDLSCHLCNRSFGQQTTLNNHIKSIHEKIRAYGCVYCLKTFGQKANLQTHIKNVHNKE